MRDTQAKRCLMGIKKKVEEIIQHMLLVGATGVGFVGELSRILSSSLNLLLPETAAPSGTFRTLIWSVAAPRAAQSRFNHGDRFKSTFPKVRHATELGITTPPKKTKINRPVGGATLLEVTLSPAPALLDGFHCTFSLLFVFTPSCYIHASLPSDCRASLLLQLQLSCDAAPAVSVQHEAKKNNNPNSRTSEGIPAWRVWQSLVWKNKTCEKS